MNYLILFVSCVSISCKALENQSQGYSMLDESYSAGEQADIKCQPGHNLHQQAPLVCDHTG